MCFPVAVKCYDLKQSEEQKESKTGTFVHFIYSQLPLISFKTLVKTPKCTKLVPLKKKKKKVTW